MNILLLGGTQFIGRHVAVTLLALGHALTVFNRGQTPDDLPPSVERLRGDRDAGSAGLSALNDRRWDACLDFSGFTPAQVRPSAAALRGRIGQYVFVSAVSVYGDPHLRPVCESHPRVPAASEHLTEIDAATYGPLKVACEDIVLAEFGDRATILRPQIVAGPRDPFDRLSYWVRRATQPGPTLAPGDGSDHVQVIDVRDVAQFVALVLQRGIAGAFNLAGPRLTWTRFVELLSVEQPSWVSSDALRHSGLSERELPLYRPERGPRSGLMDVSSAAAQAVGLRLTPPEETIRSVRAWLPHCPLKPALARQMETRILADWRRRRI
ncbi:MAG: NAD-dependent epimerase/dehydratase family protein [Planctomycetia bacterium]|nr:MAG: NAD-dependent epimerase/dehydratase family protein [Planctomycetia bacterium]